MENNALNEQYSVRRTGTASQDFMALVNLLDHELWTALGEDQSTYEQYNYVPGIDTAVVLYDGEKAVACGCYKPFAEDAVEIKRMFVQKPCRGKGLSKKVLLELETWALEKGYRFAVLETSVHFSAAIGLYTSFGYNVIPNYPPYTGLTASICMRKDLAKTSTGEHLRR